MAFSLFPDVLAFVLRTRGTRWSRIRITKIGGLLRALFIRRKPIETPRTDGLFFSPNVKTLGCWLVKRSARWSFSYHFTDQTPNVNWKTGFFDRQNFARHMNGHTARWSSRPQGRAFEAFFKNLGSRHWVDREALFFHFFALCGPYASPFLRSKKVHFLKVGPVCSVEH